nr:MAG TPA: hypothetical protein [Caudoviricetes sp.]DAZ17886.1 MAG TPA: hypothetical protein [Caudoviricetes sp.]
MCHRLFRILIIPYIFFKTRKNILTRHRNGYTIKVS